MKKYIRFFHANSLFVKIFLVMIISIFAVSILLTYNMIKASEKRFMETFSINNNKVLEQIIEGFESYSLAVVNVANNLQQSPTVKELLTREHKNSLELFRTYYLMRAQLDMNYRLLENFQADLFIVGNDQEFRLNIMSNISLDGLFLDPVTKSALNDPRYIKYGYYSFNDDLSVIFASKALKDRTSNNVYGNVFILIEESILREFYKNYSSTGNDIIILDNNGQIVSSNREEWIGLKNRELLDYSTSIEESQSGYLEVNLTGKDYLVLSQYLPTFDMYLVNLVDRQSLIDSSINNKQIIIISISITLIATIIVFLISERMTNPLRKLIFEISTMSDNNFRQQVTLNGGYETRELGKAFNQMLDELQTYIEKTVNSEKSQRVLELKALQHQINPHFLYNTLASVKILVQQEDKERAIQTIQSLITLFQNSLGNINELNTVEQEVQIIKSYVSINQARYGNRIKVNYFITNDCLSCRLPKLVLQPFIENAFFHAFNIKKEGYIQILIAEKNNELVCEIIDNGDGMEQDLVLGDTNRKKNQLFSGIGIKNVDERIKLLYGEQYGVVINSRQGLGTQIMISLPILRGQELS